MVPPSALVLCTCVTKAVAAAHRCTAKIDQAGAGRGLSRPTPRPAVEVALWPSGWVRVGRHFVAAASGSSPAENAGTRLLQPPAGQLLDLVMRPAAATEVTAAG